MLWQICSDPSERCAGCLCACGFHLCLTPCSSSYNLWFCVLSFPSRLFKEPGGLGFLFFFFLALSLEHGEIGFDPCEFPLTLILACIFLKLFFLERESGACILFAVSLAVRALMLLQALLIMPFKWKRRGGEGGGTHSWAKWFQLSPNLMCSIFCG